VKCTGYLILVQKEGGRKSAVLDMRMRFSFRGKKAEGRCPCLGQYWLKNQGVTARQGFLVGGGGKVCKRKEIIVVCVINFKGGECR